MRIPLDYYRILGLPIQATTEQLEQAHRDRTLQLPRREYSEASIQARKQLIDEAYTVLSNTSQRQRYDAQFLTETYTASDAAGGRSATKSETRAEAADAASPEERYSPVVEIADPQLTGALLILLELGEYELVIRLGRPYLSSGQASLKSGQFGNPEVILPDVVLTLALACLELGREQWQQHQYENAAESLETGWELLNRESLFAPLRAEIQSDLYKLRPYRTLELVARPLEDKKERLQGIALLKAMLKARNGIDGAEDDLSGLNVEDFLRFIQQLRGYLTAAEQQDIFELEAQRSSAVGTYLAVYALLARGFAQHQPALIRRAKQLLMRLSGRQDIHLEQAVCAVLLGQTEEASRALELSREREPLTFIQENSQGSPDLLPGLCLYAERWLQQEVFPFFRDLDQQTATLKDYFANEQVQAYLESMPLEEASMATPSSLGGMATGHPWAQPATASEPSRSPNVATAASVAAMGAVSFGDEAVTSADWFNPDQLGTAGRVAQLSPEGQLQARQGEASNNGGVSAVVEASAADDVRLARTRPRRGRRSPKWGRLSLIALITLLCAGALGFVAMRALSWISDLLSGPQLTGEPLSVDVSQPAIALPDTNVEKPPASDAKSIAKETIEAWFAAKAAALGKEHDTAKLSAILAEPTLAKWVKQAEASEANGWHVEYRHALEITSVEPDDPEAKQLTVKATVSEKASFYQFGTQDTNASYDDLLNMQYQLVRQGDRWMIASFDLAD